MGNYQSGVFVDVNGKAGFAIQEFLVVFVNYFGGFFECGQSKSSSGCIRAFILNSN